jgi:hypothetical protein
MSESNRKLVQVELASFNISQLDDEQVAELIKVHVNQLTNVYRKHYEDINSTIIGKELVEGEDENLHCLSEKKLVISASREETDEEFSTRMGINRENSWDVQYAALANCSTEEAKAEMGNMLESERLMTPADWLQHKVDKVKEVLNVEEKEEE